MVVINISSHSDINVFVSILSNYIFPSLNPVI